MSFVFIGMKSMLYYGGRNSWFCITTSADYFVLRCEGLCFSRFLDISRGWPSISRCSHRHRWLLARYSQVLGMRQKAQQFSKVFTKARTFSSWWRPGVVKESCAPQATLEGKCFFRQLVMRM